MKTTINPNANIAQEWQGVGTYAFASFNRLIALAIEHGELRLDTDEFVEGVMVSENGIDVKIGKK